MKNSNITQTYLQPWLYGSDSKALDVVFVNGRIWFCVIFRRRIKSQFSFQFFSIICISDSERESFSIWRRDRSGLRLINGWNITSHQKLKNLIDKHTISSFPLETRISSSWLSFPSFPFTRKCGSSSSLSFPFTNSRCSIPIKPMYNKHRNKWSRYHEGAFSGKGGCFPDNKMPGRIRCPGAEENFSIPQDRTRYKKKRKIQN